MGSGNWPERLLDWYRRNRRDLPWRHNQDPYAIWVSEVMLQQTQVATVIPYYRTWMRRFPTVETLAEASEAEVLALWQGLGYYRRARNLWLGARQVMAEGLPTDYRSWLNVRGVGAYTAAAIASIANDEPVAVVDGNVERVFARFAAHSETGTALRRQAQAWASEVLVRESPGDWNQALMELGATVCRPAQAVCSACPLEAECVARQTWSVPRYPAKRKAPETRRETHVVWVPFFEGRFGIRQISEGQWWLGMWEFPRVADPDATESLREFVGDGWAESLGHIRHQVTHHKICLEAWLIRCEAASPKLEWKSAAELASVAMPTPQRKVLRMALATLGAPPAGP